MGNIVRKKSNVIPFPIERRFGAIQFMRVYRQKPSGVIVLSIHVFGPFPPRLLEGLPSTLRIIRANDYPVEILGSVTLKLSSKSDMTHFIFFFTPEHVVDMEKAGATFTGRHQISNIHSINFYYNGKAYRIDNRFYAAPT